MSSDLPNLPITSVGDSHNSQTPGANSNQKTQIIWIFTGPSPVQENASLAGKVTHIVVLFHSNKNHIGAAMTTL